MIKLFINRFQHKDAERQKEMDFCLQMNEQNPLIDEIVLITSDKRPSYEQAFDLMHDEDINILANSDIYFDDTLHFVRLIQNREFWCLTRWEYMMVKCDQCEGTKKYIQEGNQLDCNKCDENGEILSKHASRHVRSIRQIIV